MTRGEYEQMSLRFWEHYQKACEKHPFFAKFIMVPFSLKVIEGASEEWQRRTRLHNANTIDLFKKIEEIKDAGNVVTCIGNHLL